MASILSSTHWYKELTFVLAFISYKSELLSYLCLFSFISFGENYYFKILKSPKMLTLNLVLIFSLTSYFGKNSLGSLLVHYTFMTTFLWENLMLGPFLWIVSIEIGITLTKYVAETGTHLSLLVLYSNHTSYKRVFLGTWAWWYSAVIQSRDWGNINVVWKLDFLWTWSRDIYRLVLKYSVRIQNG